MKKNWDKLTTYEQSEYLARAAFLKKKDYSGLSEESLAKQIYEKSPEPQG